MSIYCLNCQQVKPPSKGNKKRIYCSKKCANQYAHMLERQKHPRYNDPTWKRKGELKKLIPKKKQREYEQRLKEGYMPVDQIMAIADFKNVATIHSRARALDIIPIKAVRHSISGTGTMVSLFHEKDIDRLINEAITPEHDNEYIRKTRARAKLNGKSYRQRPAVKAREAKRRRDKRRSDPAYRLRNNVSALVYDALVIKQGKTKGGSTFAHMEYTPAQLKEHLESQFDAHMSWENYGTYWQLDHVIPQAALIYDSLSHPNFKKCWKLDNLRPLERTENLRKGSFHAGKRHHYND
jgi:hypothetical protein